MGYLTDVARRRIAAVILAVASVLAAMAISDTGFFSDPPSDEQQASDAVREFFSAAASGDFDRYCDLLTDSARDSLRSTAARLLEESDEKLSCPDIASLAKDRFAGLEVKVRQVVISGNRARVEVLLKPPDQPSQFKTILLEMEDEGAWLISDQG